MKTVRVSLGLFDTFIQRKAFESNQLAGTNYCDRKPNFLPRCSSIYTIHPSVTKITMPMNWTDAENKLMSFAESNE